MLMSKNCIDYFAPEIEVHEICVENGFAGSVEGGGSEDTKDVDWEIL